MKKFIKHFSEPLFKRVAQSRKKNIRDATHYEDCTLHFDFELDNNSKKFKIEVKSTKKENRKDKEVNYKIIWLEYRAVKGLDGNTKRPGWLFGESDYIAILDENELVYKFIPTKKLLEYALKLCPNWTENVIDSPRENKPFHKPLTRKDKLGNPRHDIIIMDQLKNVEHLILKGVWSVDKKMYLEEKRIWEEEQKKLKGYYV
jgi:hypothetical protein